MTDHRPEVAATEAWVRDHYAHGADALDIDGFMHGMADDVRLTASADADAGTVFGSDAVRQAAVKLFSKLTSLSHDIHRVEIPTDDVAVVEATVHYRFVTGGAIAVPCITTFLFRGHEVSEINLDIDIDTVAIAPSNSRKRPKPLHPSSAPPTIEHI